MENRAVCLFEGESNRDAAIRFGELTEITVGEHGRTESGVENWRNLRSNEWQTFVVVHYGKAGKVNGFYARNKFWPWLVKI
jgi:hypothetical protein